MICAKFPADEKGCHNHMAIGMNWWRWTVIAGIGVIIVMLSFGTIPNMKACSPGDPIFAFEMVRSPAEVAALFPSHCRALHAQAQRIGLWIDIGIFVWTYSAFLICGLLGLRIEGGPLARRLAVCGLLGVLAAAAADQFENVQLLRLLDALPGDQSMIDALYPAPRIKFALLGLMTMVAGALHLAQPAWRKVVGAAALFGGLWSVVGLFANPHWVLRGSVIGWGALLIAALILSLRAERSLN